MQSNILNIENWSSYKDEVGTHYTYKINNHFNRTKNAHLRIYK